MALDFLIRLLTTGADAAKADFEGVAGSAKGVDSELSKVGDNDGLEKAGASAKSFGDKLETVRNIGAGMAAIGAVGMAISESFTQAALEADALGSKMAALLDGAGISETTDQVRALADQLAIAGEGDNDEIAKNIAEAVAGGRLMALKEYGIVLSDTAKESIKAAEAVSEHAGKMELMNQVTLAGGEAVKILRANSSDAALSLAEMDHRMAELSEGIGLGTSAAKAQLYEGILAPILSILESSPELQQTTGYIFAIGSTALTAGGSMLGLVAQIGMSIPALTAMGVTGTTAFASMSAAAVPVIVALGQILLVALLAAAAIYALDKALHYKEDRELAANIAKGDATDQQRLDIANKARAKKGLPAQTMAEFEGDPNADDKVTGQDPAVQIADIQKKYDAMGAIPAVMPTVAPAIAPILATPKAKAGGGKNGELKEPPLPPGTGPGAHWELGEDGYWGLDAGEGGIGSGMQVASRPGLAPFVPPTPEQLARRKQSKTTGTDPLSLALGLAGKAFSGKGGSTPSGAQSGGTAQVGKPEYRQDSSGVWWVKFPDLRLPPGGFQQAAMSYRN